MAKMKITKDNLRVLKVIEHEGGGGKDSFRDFLVERVHKSRGYMSRSEYKNLVEKTDELVDKALVSLKAVGLIKSKIHKYKNQKYATYKMTEKGRQVLGPKKTKNVVSLVSDGEGAYIDMKRGIAVWRERKGGPWGIDTGEGGRAVKKDFKTIKEAKEYILKHNIQGYLGGT